MFWEEVDVVCDDHNVADLEIGIHAACGIWNKQCVDTQGFHNSDRERHLLHAISFIEMEASLHSHYTFVAEISENQFSAVSLNCWNREIRYVLIVQLIGNVNMVYQFSKTSAKNNGCSRDVVDFW